MYTVIAKSLVLHREPYGERALTLLLENDEYPIPSALNSDVNISEGSRRRHGFLDVTIDSLSMSFNDKITFEIHCG